MSNYLKEPIIFLGFPRSGTTIISEIIMQHHKLAWVSNYQAKLPSSSKINWVRNIFDNKFWQIRGKKNQLNQVPLLNKYIFKPAESYRFWDSLTKRDFSYSFLFETIEKPSDTDRIRSHFKDLVKCQNRKRLAFKITGPARLTYLHSLFPDAYFIWIKREPLPTLRSLLRVGFWQRKGKAELWWSEEGIYNKDEEERIKLWQEQAPALLAAIQWYKVNVVYEQEKEQLGLKDKIVEVSYEKFIEHYDEVINSISECIELKKDEDIRRYLKENEIYNRNKKEDYYTSPEKDEQILKIATSGVE